MSATKKTATALQSLFMYGAPGRIRTYDLLIRSPFQGFPPICVDVHIRLFSWAYINFHSVADHRKPLTFGQTAVKSAVKTLRIIWKPLHRNMGTTGSVDTLIKSLFQGFLPIYVNVHIWLFSWNYVIHVFRG